jgi:hypothetical protein
MFVNKNDSEWLFFKRNYKMTNYQNTFNISAKLLADGYTLFNHNLNKYGALAGQYISDLWENGPENLYDYLNIDKAVVRSVWSLYTRRLQDDQEIILGIIGGLIVGRLICMIIESRQKRIMYTKEKRRLINIKAAQTRRKNRSREIFACGVMSIMQSNISDRDKLELIRRSLNETNLFTEIEKNNGSYCPRRNPHRKCRGCGVVRYK